MDSDLEYLSSSFDPSSLTVPRLRAILVTHDIPYPASAKKPQLLDLFTYELLPQARKLLAAQKRIRRTSKGIVDMPSSQEGTADGDDSDDDDDDASLMPPPTIPDTQRRATRKSRGVSSEDTEVETRTSRKSTDGLASSSKHPRTSDTEPEPNGEVKRPLVRRTRRSDMGSTVKIEEPEHPPVRPSMRESAFSHENPFQSGSSPLLNGENRRRSAGTSGDRRKSSSRRRRTEGISSADSKRKQEDGVVVPSSKTFEAPVARRKTRVEEEPQDEVEAGEEFTPEAQLELAEERAVKGQLENIPARKKKQVLKSGGISRSAPWVVSLTLFAGYAIWFRREKLQVGYCGIGSQSTALSDVRLPDWASILQPSCELCPQHAYCYEGMETRCENGYLLQPHPLSLAGLIPLPPTCEPDGEKARKVKAVADRAVEELRERRAKYECGTLLDSKGKEAKTVEINEQSLKQEVGKNRRRGMSEAEFEDLWKGALGEIMGREEVVGDENRLTSTSLTRLPLACSLRRSVRLTLARHRTTLAFLILLCTSLFYARTRILVLRSDKSRVPALVTTTLDRLATQAALHARGESSESWISVGQLRDDVLREEFDLKRRESMWKRVRAVVESNANVRASVREGRGGEVSRVWEWIGHLGLLEGGRESRRVTFGAVEDEKVGEMDMRKWDEGRPIY